MYLIVIAWLYVTLLMGLAEAFSSQGTVLGAVVTFVMYGVLPMSLVVYLMGTPLRRKAIRKAAEEAQQPLAQPQSVSEPNAGGHSAGLSKEATVAPVRKID